MIRLYEVVRGRTRFEVAVFGDGAVAVRRRGVDRLLDHTATFENAGEAEEELGFELTPLKAKQLAGPFQEVSVGYEPTEEADEP